MCVYVIYKPWLIGVLHKYRTKMEEGRGCGLQQTFVTDIENPYICVIHRITYNIINYGSTLYIGMAMV